MRKGALDRVCAACWPGGEEKSLGGIIKDRTPCARCGAPIPTRKGHWLDMDVPARSFMDAALAGVLKDPAEQIYNYIEHWHRGPKSDPQPLHDFLGMSWEEYGRWLRKPKALSEIMAERVSSATSPDGE